jgi:TP53 regulating kinase-like protein
LDNRLVTEFKGAEAIVEIYGDVVIKRRIQKGYRVKELDVQLRKERTRSEAKIQADARKAGVPTPIIYDIETFSIAMERIKGSALKFILNEKICEKAGETLCMLHLAGIAHGDPTTYNMMYSENRVYLIDFGLAYYDGSLEARGVDLHVFFQTLAGTHEKFEPLKDAFILGYGKHCLDVIEVLDKVEEIKERGRYL